MSSHFVTDSLGHCFFCLDQLAPKTGSDSSQLHSLHALSRYLKLDMRSVFTQGPIPPHLLAKVQRSRLKAWMCIKCADLIDKFSKLSSQLEKIDMEVKYCLGIIRGKLFQAE